MAKGTINKVTIIGRVGQKPELRHMPSGNAVIQLSIATNESYKDKNTGQAVDSTEWHRVNFFGKPAEVLNQYIDKGSMLYIEGRINTRKWQDQQGQDRYSTEIIGREFQFIGGSRTDGQEQQNYSPADQQPSSAPAPDPSAENSNIPSPNISSFDDFDDEIPF